MGGSDRVTVRPEDLVSHAGHVEAVASEVEIALDAARATRPTPDAYGRLCTIVPMLLDELQGMVVDGIDTAVRSLRDTADRVRSVAEAYQATDEHNAAALDQVGGSP